MKLPQILHQDRELVRQSNLFDADWYQDTYGDVAMNNREPLDHFLTYGTVLGRDPSPQFSTIFYRNLYGRACRNVNVLVYHLTQPNAIKRGDFVLLGAYEVAKLGRVDLAQALALQYLPKELHAAFASLEMMEAIWQANFSNWVRGLNKYLAAYGQAGLIAAKGDTSHAEIFPKLHTNHKLPAVTDGPLISVLMTVYNMAECISYAANSILKQTWRNLELIIVDDASTDNGWEKLQVLAAQDTRIHLVRCGRNIGPYAAKNLALKIARGVFVTGQDGDDWSHPQRLENHMRAHLAQPSKSPLSLSWGLRLDRSGVPTHISRAQTELSIDGFARRVPISCLIEKSFFDTRLGAWDSVRFGGDTELLLRAEHILGHGVKEVPVIAMLCRDVPGSLSNHPEHGTRIKGHHLSIVRRIYMTEIHKWLTTILPGQLPVLPFPHTPRYYPAPNFMLAQISDIQFVLENDEISPRQ